ncbi:nuclear transport factor 2 family protein [Streptomyces sp. NPDC059176]|uniref:nuclear transport factor 2 family protein n=1 Tax=Streptomyces sp. NPDC059176 TaxID=3346758 RepID=UPI003682037B
MVSASQFEDYAEEFSAATDKSDVFDRYYSPDAIFDHPYKGIFRGKAEIVGFWSSGEGSGHAGILETLHLKNFVASGNKVAAEFEIEWRCVEDTDYLGPRKKGETFWGRCAAFYESVDGKFNHVTLYLNLIEGALNS